MASSSGSLPATSVEIALFAGHPKSPSCSEVAECCVVLKVEKRNISPLSAESRF